MSNIIYEIDQKADKFSDKAVEEYHEEGYDDDFGEYDHQVSEEFAQEIVDDLSVAELIELATMSGDSRVSEGVHLFNEGHSNSEYTPIFDYLQTLAWYIAYDLATGKTRSDLEDGE